MAALPTELTYLTVTAKMTRTAVDSADAGTSPDGVPLSGQVTFLPQIGKRSYDGALKGGGQITVATATGKEIVVVAPAPVTLAGGALTIDLVDPKCAAIVNNSGWSWTAHFDLTDASGAVVPQPDITFDSPAGSQLVNLADKVSVEISTGGVTFINEAAASATASAASAVSSAASAASAAQAAALVGAPADSAVAALAGNPASATRAALSATFVPSSGPSTIAGLKDFTTAPTVNGAAFGGGGGTLVETPADSGLGYLTNVDGGGGAVASVAGRTGAVVLTSTDVGLGSVTNTADTAKPVSTAQATALALKAPLASPAFTGSPTVNGSAIGSGGGTALPVAYQSSSTLDPAWDLCVSAASFLDTPAMGTLRGLGSDANEIEYSGVAPVTADDGTFRCWAPSGSTAYRSEIIFASDGTDGKDYSDARFVEGQRVRIAFDVKTMGMDRQDSGAWNSVFQCLGHAVSGAFPFKTLSINIENKQWKIGGGDSITFSETTRSTHEDNRWTRWELDILLGRAGVGTVSVWKDGQQVCLAWKPTSGTYYAGTGNNAIDLTWLYFKNGVYGGATTTPVEVSAMFRNRRFSVTETDGVTTTTWRGPQTSTPGMHIFKRNPTTGMAY